MNLQSIVERRKQIDKENRRSMRIRLNTKEFGLIISGLMQVKEPHDVRVLKVLKQRLMKLVE